MGTKRQAHTGGMAGGLDKSEFIYFDPRSVKGYSISCDQIVSYCLKNELTVVG